MHDEKYNTHNISSDIEKKKYNIIVEIAADLYMDKVVDIQSGTM